MNVVDMIRRVDGSVLVDRYGIESELVRRVVIATIECIKQYNKWDTPLAQEMLRDLELAMRAGCFEEELLAYSLALHSICRDEKVYRDDPLCNHLKQVYTVVQIDELIEAMQSRSIIGAIKAGRKLKKKLKEAQKKDIPRILELYRKCKEKKARL